MLRSCKRHGNTDHFKRKDQNGWRCKKCATESVVRRTRKVKRTLVEEFGGKCLLCGYDKCVEALQFHHLSPKDKLMQISGGSIGIDRLRKEASKCVLLCGNCHVEVEYGHAKLTSLCNSIG